MTSESYMKSGVGVIIPVYNRAQTLLGTLPYVAVQTVPPEELVIVDDGSDDDSAAAAEGWLAANPQPFRTQVIRARHGGGAKARNIGLAALSQVPYIAFLDSDDHWPADFLQRTSSLLSGNPQAVAVSVDRRYLDANREIVCETDCTELAADPINWMFCYGAGLASCSLFRLDVVKRFGGWIGTFGLAEDFQLFVEIALQGKWLHSPGEPVEFDLGWAEANGEQKNFQQHYTTKNWQWICVYEQIYRSLLDRNVELDQARVEKAIADAWSQIGKGFASRGERGEAANCFVKSIRWKPVQLRSWRRLAINTLKSIGQTESLATS